MTNVLIAVVAFVLMEPVAAGAHRLVMHGRGWAWHHSHHVGRHTRIEANDLYPFVFSLVTAAAMVIAVVAGCTSVLAVGTGVTVYGLAYLTVHHVCVHGRLSGAHPVVRGRWLRWVAASHARHHRTNAAPYGFLFPVPPRSQARPGSRRRGTRPGRQLTDPYTFTYGEPRCRYGGNQREGPTIAAGPVLRHEVGTRR